MQREDHKTWQKVFLMSRIETKNSLLESLSIKVWTKIYKELQLPLRINSWDSFGHSIFDFLRIQFLLNEDQSNE